MGSTRLNSLGLFMVMLTFNVTEGGRELGRNVGASGFGTAEDGRDVHAVVAMFILALGFGDHFGPVLGRRHDPGFRILLLERRRLDDGRLGDMMLEVCGFIGVGGQGGSSGKSLLRGMGRIDCLRRLGLASALILGDGFAGKNDGLITGRRTKGLVAIAISVAVAITAAASIPVVPAITIGTALGARRLLARFFRASGRRRLREFRDRFAGQDHGLIAAGRARGCWFRLGCLVVIILLLLRRLNKLGFGEPATATAATAATTASAPGPRPFFFGRLTSGRGFGSFILRNVEAAFEDDWRRNGTRAIAVGREILGFTIFGARGRLLGLGLANRDASGGHSYGIELLLVIFHFEEIGDVEEGVALQANINEGGLHSGEDAGNAPLVDGSSEGVFVFALVINFCELIVLVHRNLGFVRRQRDK